jgi:hypothetical protein
VQNKQNENLRGKVENLVKKWKEIKMEGEGRMLSVVPICRD